MFRISTSILNKRHIKLFRSTSYDSSVIVVAVRMYFFSNLPCNIWNPRGKTIVYTNVMYIFSHKTWIFEERVSLIFIPLFSHNLLLFSGRNRPVWKTMCYRSAVLSVLDYTREVWVSQWVNELSEWVTMTSYPEHFNDTVVKVVDEGFPLLMPRWGYVVSAFVLFLIGFFGFFLNLMVILLMFKDRQVSFSFIIYL